MSAPVAYPAQPQLVQYPHPILRKIAEPVTEFSPELSAFADAMVALMYADRGVGLAAPQVAVSQRILVTDPNSGHEDRTPEPQAWINPTIESLDGETMIGDEGCLSLPGLFSQVERWARIRVSYQDVDGQAHTRDLFPIEGDFLGIILQHELDHLDGKLFVDHLSPPQLALLRRKLKGLEKTYKKANGSAGAVLRR